jgi:hypothetical protein
MPPPSGELWSRTRRALPRRPARLGARLGGEPRSELNDLERGFLDESRAANEREAERQRRVNRRLRSLLVGVGVLLAAAVVAGLIALSERQGARDAAIAADAQRLGAEALSEDRLEQALLLANAGAALDDSLATRSNLLSTLLRSPATIGVLNGDGDPFTSRALSPDGATLAVGDEGGTVTLFDTETREPIGDHQAPRRPPGSPGVWSLDFDPGGDSLAVAGSAGSGLRSAFVEILDADTARVRSSISLGRQPSGANLGYFVAVKYGPDGRSLIVTYSAADLDYTSDVFMRRFDARRHSAGEGRPGRPTRSTSAATLSSPDGRLLVSSDRATYARGRADGCGSSAATAVGSPRGRGDQRRRRTLAVEDRAGPSPARPSLRAGADACGAAAGDLASGPSAPRDERSPPGTRAGT